jgi:hypothetical protein
VTTEPGHFNPAAVTLLTMSRKRYTMPLTLPDLIRAGGPETLARRAAHEAAQTERRFWLRVLSKLDLAEDGGMVAATVMVWLRTLRKQLRIPAPRDKDLIRAQTRERVRRYRERKNPVTVVTPVTNQKTPFA